MTVDLAQIAQSGTDVFSIIINCLSADDRNNLRLVCTAVRKALNCTVASVRLPTGGGVGEVTMDFAERYPNAKHASINLSHMEESISAGLFIELLLAVSPHMLSNLKTMTLCTSMRHESLFKFFFMKLCRCVCLEKLSFDIHRSPQLHFEALGPTAQARVAQMHSQMEALCQYPTAQDPDSWHKYPCLTSVVAPNSTPLGWPLLSQLSGLQALDVSLISVLSQYDVINFTPLTRLTSLIIPTVQSETPNKSVEFWNGVGGLTNLRHLYIKTGHHSQRPDEDDDDAWDFHIPTSWTALTALTYMHISHSVDAPLLAPFTWLRHLHVSIREGNGGLHHLASLAELTQLRFYGEDYRTGDEEALGDEYMGDDEHNLEGDGQVGGVLGQVGGIGPAAPLAPLAAPVQLEFAAGLLDLELTYVDGSVAAMLTQLTALTKLDIGLMPVLPAASITVLEPLQNLRWLCISGQHMHEEWCRTFTALPLLTELTLNFDALLPVPQDNIAPPFLGERHEFPSLKKLNFNFFKNKEDRSADTLRCLLTRTRAQEYQGLKVQCPGLPRDWRADMCEMGEGWLGALQLEQKFGNWIVRRDEHCATIGAMAAEGPLVLYLREDVSAVGLRELVGAWGGDCLTVACGWTMVLTTAHVQGIAESMPGLRFLHLGGGAAGCSEVGDLALVAIAQSCSELEVLTMQGASAITDSGVGALAACSFLHTLQLRRATAVTSSGVLPLLEQGVLRSLVMNDCNVSVQVLLDELVAMGYSQQHAMFYGADGNRLTLEVDRMSIFMAR